jgi:hypothetical protein
MFWTENEVNMFWTEEDIQPVVNAVIRRMGKAGRMSYGKQVLMNVIVSTPQFGAVWYGDFEGTVDELTRISSELSAETGYVVRVTH